MARQWFALIADMADYRTAYHHGLSDRKAGSNAERRCRSLLSPEVWESYQALAGRAMDGGALLEYLLADLCITPMMASRALRPGTWALSTIEHSDSWHGPPDFSPSRRRPQTMRGCPTTSIINLRHRLPCLTEPRKSTSPMTTHQGNLIGTASIWMQASRRWAAFPAPRRPAFHPTSRSQPFQSRLLFRNAQHPLVDIRRSRDQLRRHRRQHDGCRKAALHRIRSRVLERLVRDTVHAALGFAGPGPRHGCNKRLRRAPLDSGSRSGCG